jgi:hypothetical protein
MVIGGKNWGQLEHSQPLTKEQQGMLPLREVLPIELLMESLSTF